MTTTIRAAIVATMLAACLLPGSVRTAAAAAVSEQAVDDMWKLSIERRKPIRDVRQVVDLLREGRRDSAKRALAAILTRRPDDSAALEIAGMLLLEEGQLEPAEAAFRRSLTAAPGSAQVLAKLGVTLLVGGQLDRGEVELKKALEADPNEPLALRYAGWLAAARGNGPAAAGYYEKLLDAETLRSGPLTDIHLDLAQVYNSIGRFDRALQVLAGAGQPQAGAEANARLNARAADLRLAAYVEMGDLAQARKLAASLPAVSDRSSPERIFAESAIARLERNYDRAEQLLGMIAETSPALAARKHYELGRVFRDRQDWDRVAKSLELAAAKATDDQIVFVMRELAAALTSTGKGDRALEILVEQADRRPGNAGIRYLGAEVAFEIGRMGTARRLAGELLAKHPDLARAHYIAGLVEWKDSRPEDAIAALRKAAALDPGDAPVWIALARVRDDEGDFEGMVATLQEGLQAIPHHPVLLFELATAHQSRDDEMNANKLYRRILEHYPNHVPAMNALGLNLAAHKASLDEARKLITRAYQLAPNDPAIRGSYGWIAFKSGDTVSSLPLLEEAAKALPENGPALYHLAAAYYALGRVAEAAPLVQKAEDVGGVPGPEHHAVHDLIRKTRRAKSSNTRAR